MSIVAPSLLPQFFEEMQQVFTQAGDEDSVIPIRMFYRRWAVTVAIERKPSVANRLHAAELAIGDPDAEVRAQAIREAGDIVRAAHREVAGDRLALGVRPRRLARRAASRSRAGGRAHSRVGIGESWPRPHCLRTAEFKVQALEPGQRRR